MVIKTERATTIFIRNVPAAEHREIKSAAAAAGVTLREFVIQAALKAAREQR
jgi:uncharacterized protein (DUF1778 family)